MRMSKSKPATMLPFKLFGRVDNAKVVGGKLKGTRVCGMMDLASGRVWEWSEADHPELRDYLSELLGNLHPLAHHGSKFPVGRKKNALAAHTRAILDVWKPGHTADQCFNWLLRDKRFQRVSDDTVRFRDTGKMFRRHTFGVVLSRLIHRKSTVLTNSGKR